MEVFLPSDVAKLVYGYLLDESCDAAAREFLKSSSKMGECLTIVNKGQTFHRKVSGKTLTDFLDVLSGIVHLVNMFLENADGFDKSAGDVLSKICSLLGLGNKFSLLKEKVNERKESYIGENVVTIPGPLEADEDDARLPTCASTPKEKNSLDDSLIDHAIFDTLLNKKAFHEKLAHNINKAISSSEVQLKNKEKSPLKESTIVKDALSSTEADPLFDEVIKEILAAAPPEESSAPPVERSPPEIITTEVPQDEEDKTTSETEGKNKSVGERRQSLVELAMEGCVDPIEEPAPVTQDPQPTFLIQLLPSDSIVHCANKESSYRKILPKPTLGPIIEPAPQRSRGMAKLRRGVRTRGGIMRTRNSQRMCSLVPKVNTLEGGHVVAEFVEERVSCRVLRKSSRVNKNNLSDLPEEGVEEEIVPDNFNENIVREITVELPQENQDDSSGLLKDNVVSEELTDRNVIRPTEANTKDLDLVGSAAAEVKTNDDSSVVLDKVTPSVRPKSLVKKSLSSPRKGSHVRVLDFRTPAKGVSPRKANTSPKAVSQSKLSQLRALRRVSLFKSPLKENLSKKDNSSWDKDLRSYVEGDLPVLSKKVVKPVKNKPGRPRRMRLTSPPRTRASRRIPRKTRLIDRNSELYDKSSTNDDIIDEIRKDVFNTLLLDAVPSEEHNSVATVSLIKFDKAVNTPNKTENENNEINDCQNLTEKNSDETFVGKTPVMPQNDIEFSTPSRPLTHEKVLNTPAKPTEMVDSDLTPVSKILKEQMSLLDKTILLTPGLPPTPQIVGGVNNRRPVTPVEFLVTPSSPEQPTIMDSPNTSLQNTLINECIRIEEGIRQEKEILSDPHLPSHNTVSSPCKVPAVVVSPASETLDTSSLSPKLTNSYPPAVSPVSNSSASLSKTTESSQLKAKKSKQCRNKSSENSKQQNESGLEPSTVSPEHTKDSKIPFVNEGKRLLSSGRGTATVTKPKQIGSKAKSPKAHSPTKPSTTDEKCNSQKEEIINKCLNEALSNLFGDEKVSTLCESPHKSEKTHPKKNKSSPVKTKLLSPVEPKSRKLSLSSSKKRRQASKLSMTTDKKEIDDSNTLPSFKDIMEKLKSPTVTPKPFTMINSGNRKEEECDTNDTFPTLVVSEDDSSDVTPIIENANSLARNCINFSEQCVVSPSKISPSEIDKKKPGIELIKDFSRINHSTKLSSEDCQVNYFDEETQTERSLNLSPMITCFEYPFPNFKDRDKISEEVRENRVLNDLNKLDPRCRTSPERNYRKQSTCVKSDSKMDRKSKDVRKDDSIVGPFSPSCMTEKYRHRNLPRILDRRDYVRNPLNRYSSRNRALRGDSVVRSLPSRSHRSWRNSEREAEEQRRRRMRDNRERERSRRRREDRFRREEDRLRRGQDDYKERYFKTPTTPDFGSDPWKNQFVSGYSRDRQKFESRSDKFNGDIQPSVHATVSTDKLRSLETESGHIERIVRSRQGKEPRSCHANELRRASSRESSNSLSGVEDTHPPKDPRLRKGSSNHSTPVSLSQCEPLPSTKRKREKDSREREEGEISDGDTSIVSAGSSFNIKKKRTGSPYKETEVLNRGKNLLKNVDVDRFLSIVHGSP